MDQQPTNVSVEVLERIESDLHLIARLLQDLVEVSKRIDRRLS
jgi:hypothetical protein